MATAIIDNWTEMNCIQLIREFRVRPILWDQKDPFYYKKTLKPKFWEEIGEKLDIPALECKHKMNILMSSFRREKAKILHAIEDSNEDTSNMCTSTWFAFKEMMFLLDKDTERKRRLMGSNIIDDEIQDNNDSRPSLKKTLLKHHVQPPISNNKRPRFSGLLQDVAKQASNTATSSVVLQQKQTPANSSEADDDEIKSFANFISFKMKKYSETTKNAVQQAICDIIFKADQNFYENSAKCKFPQEEADDDDLFAKSVGHEDISKIKEEYETVCFVEEDSD